MKEDIHLGRVAGVPIGANWSLLVVFWLIAWMLAATELPAGAKGYPAAAYWAVAIGAALLFYGCLLAHELAHSIVARRAGMKVEGIVLWLFGGVSQLGGDAAGPDIELRMAAAGPLTSIGLGAAFLAAAGAGDAVGASRLVVTALEWLAWINGILGVFNLAPAFPLDGGRVLRALLWRHHGDKIRATRTAAAAGRQFAYVLIVFGLFEFAVGAGLGGLWLVFLGWFLLGAAKAEGERSLLATELGGMTVRSVMTPNPIVAPADVTVQELLDQWLYPNRGSSFPVLDADRRVCGLVTLARIKNVPSDRRPFISAGAIAAPLEAVVTCAPDDDLVATVGRMAASPDQRALVFDDGRLVGIVSPTDVTRAIDRASATRSHP